MKTIKVRYDLQEITQTPEAHLSDLFILLYAIFLINNAGARASRYALNKLFPFIFERLGSELGGSDRLHIFNLPFYKMNQGHFNKSLSQKYLKELEEAKLVSEKPGATYDLPGRVKRLMEQYYNEVRKTERDKQFEDLVLEFTKRFLKDRDYNDVWTTLHSLSHSMLVEDGGVEKTVDELDVDDRKAISYNSEDFKEGRPSDIVPRPYLTLLASELQQGQKVDAKDLKEVATLLSE